MVPNDPYWKDFILVPTALKFLVCSKNFKNPGTLSNEVCHYFMQNPRKYDQLYAQVIIFAIAQLLHGQKSLFVLQNAHM